MSQVLVVTNDFPTRRGGIESFVLSLCERMPSDQVVVYTASMPGDSAYDATLPFPVYRDPSSTLLPTRAVGRRAAQVMLKHGCDRVVFGSSVPLGLLAPTLRRAGAQRIVALTHGHEVWWARVPGARLMLRHVGDSCDVLTYVSEWCREQIVPALSPAAARMVRLSPGVDTERFYPGCGGAGVRSKLGIADDAPVVVCTARMIRRKGQDTLVKAWPLVVAAVPDARMLLVGDGPHRSRVEDLSRSLGVAGSVVFTGSVPWEDIPAYTDAGNVFAMPCRTRLLGLEPEALGIVSLEAAACGLPVVVGWSGGAPETVLEGETGHVVDPGDVDALSRRLAGLLMERPRSRSMGNRGRESVRRVWSWEVASTTLTELIG